MIIVKHFLLFINNFAIYKDKYHIGYVIGDLYPKSFFFKNFSKLLLMIFYNKMGNVYFNICSPDFIKKTVIVMNKWSWVRLRNYIC